MLSKSKSGPFGFIQKKSKNAPAADTSRPWLPDRSAIYKPSEKGHKL